ncbi:cytochrome c maturation protein CcmE [Candidatus Odyssella thessalonicensis]|uniref:cytochrome c maturation protein CcmE n=1 Tax=Candidatus Odyssella thessalonicensis TaxID=84647 RepID=UPI000225ABFA|nr:cytochrome c maturation protein CcmE [Candidatus Odyssella thessalonicensis]
MTSHQRQRVKWISLITVILMGGSLFIFSALRQSMMYFMAPTEILTENPSRPVRLGGMVEKGSIIKDPATMTIHFRVTDFKSTVAASFTGLAPDLFKEGQGVVADGRWDGHVFQAEKLLAKHDENYMPIELADRLAKQ